MEEKDFLEAESSPNHFVALKTPSVSPSVSAADHPRVNKLYSGTTFFLVFAFYCMILQTSF